MDKAVMLLSGGLDSKILLAQLKSQYGEDLVGCVTIDYGKGEVKNAVKHAREYGIPHHIFKTSKFMKGDTSEVPLRNLVMLSYAAHAARTLGAGLIAYATHYPADYDKGYYYEDCSPDFASKLGKFLSQFGVELIAPFIRKTIDEEVALGMELGVDFSDVQICNVHNNNNCGECRKCENTRRVFIEKELTNQPKYLAPVHVVKNYPWLRELRLYTNNRCQKHCPFCCYRQYSEGANTDELSLKQWAEVIDKARALGIKRLMFSGKEPLIDEKIFGLLATAHDFECHINTNGLTLKDYVFPLEQSLEKGLIKRILVSLNYKDTLPLIDDIVAIGHLDQFQPYILINERNKALVPDILLRSMNAGLTRFYLRFEYPSEISPSSQERLLKEYYRLCEDHAFIAKTQPITIENPVEWTNPMSGQYLWALDQYRELGFARYQHGERLTVEYTFPHYECEAYYKTLTILHDGTILGCAKHSYLPYSEIEKISIGNITIMSPEEIEAECIRKLRSKRKMCMPKWYHGSKGKP
jgi:7-cyano-7-deazaguanine synthase in queuosine biosynthesis